MIRFVCFEKLYKVLKSRIVIIITIITSERFFGRPFWRLAFAT